MKNNEEKCILIINQKINRLNEYIEMDLNEEVFRIYLIEITSIEDMSQMFYGCNSLKSLPDISKWNMNNMTNMSKMFSDCSSLESLPDISNWNINKVIDMREIFSGCNSLKSLPYISKWNINDMTNIENFE